MTTHDDDKKAAEECLKEFRDANRQEAAAYSRTWIGLFDGQEIKEAFLAGVAHARRWIPVTERLPEMDIDVSEFYVHIGSAFESVRVLTRLEPAGNEPAILSGRFSRTLSKEALSLEPRIRFLCDERGLIDIRYVTHWQPLPPEPTEGE